MRRWAVFVPALLSLVTALTAADAAGTWKGDLATDDGSRELTFELKVDGEKLTGTVVGLLDRSLDLDEGKVDGSTITFSVVSEMEGNAVKLVYRGEVSGDEISFTMGADDGSWSTELQVKRVT